MPRLPRGGRLRCAVPGCRHHEGSLTLLKQTTLFTVPKDEERRRVWLKAIKPVNPKSANIMVCQLHFADGAITLNQKRKRIVYGAVPTLNLPGSDDVEPAPLPIEAANHEENEDMQLEEVKSEPDNGVLVDLFTEEETVVQRVQKRPLDTGESDPNFSEIPIKRETLEHMCEDGRELEPTYRYDASFPRPLLSHNQTPSISNENEFLPAKSNENEFFPSKSNDNEFFPANSRSTQLDMLITLSKAHLSPEIAKFVEVQALLKSKLNEASKRKQYSKDMLCFALKLYHKYPQAYQFMQESFCLPVMVSIRRLCRNLSWELNDTWMTILKSRFECASTAERECVVCVAKVKLGLGLSYDPARDRMTGLEEMDDVQRPRTARYAIVVYARGIISRWRQPLSYALLPPGSRPDEFWRWSEELLSKLLDVGLNPRAVVADFGEDYSPLIRPLPPSKTYFQLKDKQIYCFFDCTQLMVKLRDCFKMCDVNFKGMLAEWDVIEDLFEYDRSKKYMLAAGLTTEHLKPIGIAALKPNLAIETISASVASAVAKAIDLRALDDSAHGTVRFLTAFSKLYDILHNKELPMLEKGISPELKFLHEMLMNFGKMAFRDKQEIRDVPDPGVIRAFSKNVRAAMALQERLRRAGYVSLPLRAFNNDPLHQFFNRLKTQNGKKDLTSRQLINGFKRTFVFNIMKSFSKVGKLDGFLETVSGINDITVEEVAPLQRLAKASHIARFKRVTMGPAVLLAQCARVRPCCELGLQFCNYPPPVIAQYVSIMETKFRFYFAPEKLSKGVLASIIASLEEDQFPAPCRCFPVLFFKSLYLRFRIVNLVEYNNVKFRRGISRDFTMNTRLNSY